MRWRWMAVLGGLVAVATIALVTAVFALRDAESFTVGGTFILWDEFSAETGELCRAKRSFYHDINRDTRVTLSTAEDLLLSETSLGEGRIYSAADLAELIAVRGPEITIDETQRLLDEMALEPCVFEFEFVIQPGSDEGDGYVVDLGRRGRLEMTESEIREPGRIQLSVGLRG